MKTMTLPKTAKTMMIELVCPCGHHLEICIKKVGWYTSMVTVARANNWNINLFEDVSLCEKIPAFCPQCRSHR